MLDDLQPVVIYAVAPSDIHVRGAGQGPGRGGWALRLRAPGAQLRLHAFATFKLGG